MPPRKQAVPCIPSTRAAANPAARQGRRGVVRNWSGGPRKDSASGKDLWWCMQLVAQMKSSEPDMHRVALSARGPELAGWRPHPTSGSLAKHAEVGLRTCPSSGPSARVAPAAAWTDRGSCFGCGFRHGPCSRHANMSATGPDRWSRPRPLVTDDRAEPRPGGWLARHREGKPAASGTALATASPA